MFYKQELLENMPYVAKLKFIGKNKVIDLNDVVKCLVYIIHILICKWKTMIRVQISEIYLDCKC